jgi:hypothetical protein
VSPLLLWIVTGIYAWVAADQIRQGNLPLAAVFGGYVMANVGLIAAMR